MAIFFYGTTRYQEFEKALRDGDTSGIDAFLVSEKHHIDFHNQSGCGALDLAILSGNAKSVEHILDMRHVDPNQNISNTSKHSPMHLAIEELGKHYPFGCSSMSSSACLLTLIKHGAVVQDGDFKKCCKRVLSSFSGPFREAEEIDEYRRVLECIRFLFERTVCTVSDYEIRDMLYGQYHGLRYMGMRRNVRNIIEIMRNHRQQVCASTLHGIDEMLKNKKNQQSFKHPFTIVEGYLFEKRSILNLDCLP